MNRYTHLWCHQCDSHYDSHTIQDYCHTCTQPLQAIYDLSPCTPESVLDNSRQDMWRYRNMLPVSDPHYIVTLGEGGTPLLPLDRSRSSNSHRLYLKDESSNPTGSFKARGMSAAISVARSQGHKEFCTPTAGNAGSAMAAYVARMGGKSHIYMPIATPSVFRMDCEIMGARVVAINGSIRDAGLAMAADNVDKKWWDVSTLKEPFRLEGKKTMGYEIAEQLQWMLPDVIIYPTGGGTGLIGIWKAFEEMLSMGWISHIPTRMVAVQGIGCNPVVKAFNQNLDHCDLYENPQETIANGLRVPKPFGDKLIMRTLKESQGCAIEVTEEQIISAISTFARQEGVYLSPEGGAVYHAYQSLTQSDWIKPNEKIVLLNTGSVYKYVENL
jgi:threonine synthase